MGLRRPKFSLLFPVWFLSCLAVAVVLCILFWRDGSDEAVSSGSYVEPVEESIEGAHRALSKALQEQLATNRDEQAESASLESDRMTEVTFSARLAKILGQGDDPLDVPTRMSQLKAEGSLSDAEFVAIYNYLDQEENVSGLDDAHWLWLKNDLMTYMRDHDTDRGRYLEELEGLFANHTDSVIRDYALQHLTVMALGGEYEIDVRDVLKQGAAVKEGTIAGTALLGYSRLISEQQENVDWLRSAAEDVAGSGDHDSASRASALQVLAKLDEGVADTLASEKALEVTSPAMERVSAVAVLGRSRENFDTLKLLASDADPRVRRAARSAISKLDTQ
jgi:hypothetical protein